MHDLDIVLTNDDGINSPGFRAMYDALSEVGTVTAVAPVRDQSAVGRSISRRVEVEEHELGYAIHGTPSDCVVAALENLHQSPDLVVSGCNKGANIGAYVLGRSGTVSAAVEAAFLDVPAIAVSLYLNVGDVTFADHETTVEDYADATRATRFLARNAFEAGVFDHADYLNVNAPDPNANEGPAPIRVTTPSHASDMDATLEDGRITLHDRMWGRMATGDVPDVEGTDRRAVVDGYVSVSPLLAPHATQHHQALDGLVAAYPDIAD